MTETRKRPATGKTRQLSPLAQLESMRESFGADLAERKLALLDRLDSEVLESASGVRRFHDVVRFLLAYPDNPAVREAAAEVLRGFDRRTDLKRFRAELADSGIAGTKIHYEFFWPTARWLARRWPTLLRIDWPAFKKKQRIEQLLLALLPYAESITWDENAWSAREWIARLKNDGESDGAFLARLFDGLRAGSFIKEALFEDLHMPMTLLPGRDTPCRTRALYPASAVVFQKAARPTTRPELKRAVAARPKSVVAVPPREADRLIDLAREAMLTRQRDLNAIAYASRDDVRLVNWEGGLQFAWIGTIPERRYVLDAIYVFITLQNGVPVGYVQGSALMGSAEVNFNVFEPFRGAGAAHVYCRALATIRHLLGTDTFVLDPYQLGDGNAEALESGAWWFYYKLGFRPRDPQVERLVRTELGRMKRNPRHRSSMATLKRLAAANLYYHLGRTRDDILSIFPSGTIGGHISRYFTDRFGGDRAAGSRALVKEAAQLLGIRNLRCSSPGERLAWEWWSPLILCLPGVSRWPSADRKALARIVRAKGATHETEYAVLLDRHRRLRTALRRLASTPLD